MAEATEEFKRRLRAAFVNQDGADVPRARFSGFPGQVRLARWQAT